MTVTPGDEAPSRPARSLSRNRDFTLLWVGGVLSDVGSFSAGLAMPLLVLAITGSPAQAGLVGTVELVVGAGARSPIGGIGVGSCWRAPGCAACSSEGAGGLLGAVVAGLIQRRLGFRTLMVTVTLALVASVASATALTGRVAMAVPLAVGIFLAPSANVALFGRLAATTPDEIQARVISVVILAATGAAAVAPRSRPSCRPRHSHRRHARLYRGRRALRVGGYDRPRTPRACRPTGR